MVIGDNEEGDIQDCEHCDGTGRDPIEDGDCYLCDGKGEIPLPDRHWNRVVVKKNKQKPIK